jgi:hypothetical protein
VAGHAGNLLTGRHSKMTGTMGDLYLTLANDVMQAGVERVPTGDKTLSGIIA